MAKPIPRATGKQTPGVTRRQLLKRITGGIALAGGGTAAYAGLLEPFHPVLEEVTVRVPHLPRAFDGFRIAQLSDLHVQPGFPASRLRAAVEITLAARPDLIVLTGDYVNDHVPDTTRYMAECAAALSRLRAPSGVFTVFGNHDYPPPPADPDEAPWRAAGIATLRNSVAPIRRNSSSEVIYLVGMHSMISRPADVPPLMAEIPPLTTRILLWHEPDNAAIAAAAGASLQLSGHTHGGQVRVPFVGPLALPSFGKKYPSGLFEVRGMPLYVTRGVGLLPPMVRFNCPPEVTLLTLRPR